VTSAQLQKSVLTVHAVTSSGREQTATCPVYRGRAAATTHTPVTFTRSGMLNDCVITLDQGGPWRVRATVAWQPELRVASATLETRLEAGSPPSPSHR
jgi:mRNA-degrading endonuclease toxin of MazEF toxin-antitoxin module